MGSAIFKQGRYRISRRSDTGSLQIGCYIDGKRYRVHAGEDLGEAKRRLESFRSEIESGWRPGEQNSDPWQKVARRIRDRHKHSAEARGIPFDLIAPEVYQLMLGTDFRCAVSGIAFSRGEKMGPRGLTDPWAPSVDRIDNRLGYQTDNVRIVCVAANLGMNAWGYDTLLRLARGIIRKADAVVPEPLSHGEGKSPSLHLVGG